MGLGNKEIMAKNIQYYMSLHNETRNDLCTALGVKYTTLTDWIKGNTYPRIDKIEMMANHYGISKSDLVEEHNPSSAGARPSTAETLTASEEQLIGSFRQLNGEGQGKVIDYAADLAASGRYIKDFGMAAGSDIA